MCIVRGKLLEAKTPSEELWLCCDECCKKSFFWDKNLIKPYGARLRIVPI